MLLRQYLFKYYIWSLNFRRNITPTYVHSSCLFSTLLINFKPFYRMCIAPHYYITCKRNWTRLMAGLKGESRWHLHPIRLDSNSSITRIDDAHPLRSMYLVEFSVVITRQLHLQPNGNDSVSENLKGIIHFNYITWLLWKYEIAFGEGAMSLAPTYSQFSGGKPVTLFPSRYSFYLYNTSGDHNVSAMKLEPKQIITGRYKLGGAFGERVTLSWDQTSGFTGIKNNTVAHTLHALG